MKIKYGNFETTNLRELREHVNNKQVVVTIEELLNEDLPINQNLQIFDNDDTILFDKTIININITKQYLTKTTSIIFQYN